MSAIEIIEQIKSLPPQERRTVLSYFTEEAGADTSLYDEFSLLGSDAQGSDVSYADAAQTEVINHERA
jgi:hypothetical protein